MTIKEKIKKYIVPISAIILTVLLLSLLLSNKKTFNSNIDPSQNFKGIIPGQTEKTEVIQKLGQPVKNDFEGNLYFKTFTTALFDEVKFDNNKAVLIKEAVNPEEPRSYLTEKESLGNAEIIMYGEFEDLFVLLSYPSKGLAFLANERTGVMLEKWYFQPTSIDTFKKEIATKYSTTLEPHKGE